MFHTAQQELYTLHNINKLDSVQSSQFIKFDDWYTQSQETEKEQASTKNDEHCKQWIVTTG